VNKVNELSFNSQAKTRSNEEKHAKNNDQKQPDEANDKIMQVNNLSTDSYAEKISCVESMSENESEIKYTFLMFEGWLFERNNLVWVCCCFDLIELIKRGGPVSPDKDSV